MPLCDVQHENALLGAAVSRLLLRPPSCICLGALLAFPTPRIDSANACGAQFLHAAARMGSGSLSLAGLGSFGSGQLAEGLGPIGLPGSSSSLNIAALNPAGSGK